MSLHSHLLKETRSLFIASASGLLLSTQTLPAQTPESALPEVSVSTTRSYKEPALLKISKETSHPLFEVTDGNVIQVQHVQGQQTDQRLQRLYGNQETSAQATAETVQPVQVQPVLQTPPTPIQQTAGSRVPRKSLFDRLVGKIKGDSNLPAAPPKDPGMDYTTVTEAKLQKTQAPKLVQQPEAIPPVEKFSPPPVPGVADPNIVSVPEPMVEATPELPRSFPPITPLPEQKAETTQTAMAPESEAPPIPDTFIPPLPGSEEATSLAQEENPESFPELKAMMEAKTEEAPPQQIAKSTPSVPVAKQKEKARPLLDLSGPLPLLEDVLKAEREEAAVNIAETSDVPELKVAPEAKPIEVPAPELAEVEVPAPESVASEIADVEMSETEAAAPSMPAIAESKIDPLANPFPADIENETDSEDLNAELLQMNPLQIQEEPSVAQAPPMPAETELKTEEEPYSGLALEEDLFLKGKVPAPAEPSSILGSKVTPPAPAEMTEEEPGFASLEDTTMPELPPFPSIEEEPEVAESSASNEELTPSTEIPQLQTPQTEKRVAMAAPPQHQVQVEPKQKVQQSKMELIASRQGMTGLKGFCPVQLRDTRELVDVNENFSAIFNNKKYSFSSVEALQKFIGDPEKYAPAMHGSDIIHLSLTGEEIEGSLDYAVWFKGRLYLFSSAETMETFVAAPNSHVTDL